MCLYYTSILSLHQPRGSIESFRDLFDQKSFYLSIYTKVYVKFSVTILGTYHLKPATTKTSVLKFIKICNFLHYLWILLQILKYKIYKHTIYRANFAKLFKTGKPWLTQFCYIEHLYIHVLLYKFVLYMYSRMDFYAFLYTSPYVLVFDSLQMALSGQKHVSFANIIQTRGYALDIEYSTVLFIETRWLICSEMQHFDN